MEDAARLAVLVMMSECHYYFLVSIWLKSL